MSMFASNRFLPRTLWADALFCGLAGALQLAFLQPLSALTHLPEALLSGTGCFLLAWACVAAWGARHMPQSRALVGLAVLGNFGWAAACGVLIWSGRFDLSTAGQTWVLGQAAIGVVLGDLQCAGLWRGRDAGLKVRQTAGAWPGQ